MGDRIKPESVIGMGQNMQPLQAGDVPATHADVSDLVEDLGYKPATPVQQGIDNFVKWYREFFRV